MKKFFLCLLVYFCLWLTPVEAKDVSTCPYGINYGGGGLPETHLSSQEHEYLLGEIKEAGICWIRFRLAWWDIEKEPGKYQWESYDYVIKKAHSLGLKIILGVNKTPLFYATESDIMCPPARMDVFERFMNEAVERYKNYIDVWLIENEVYSKPCFQAYPEQYPQMMKTASRVIRAKAPQAKIAPASIAYHNKLKGFIKSWLEESKREFDVVTINAHRPEDSDVLAVIQNVRSILEEIGVNKAIWLTETSLNIKDNPEIDAYARFEARVSSALTKADKIFWFKHTTGIWGPGIFEKTASGYQKTLLWEKYKNLIEKAGWVGVFPIKPPSQPTLIGAPTLPPAVCDCQNAGEFKLRGDANCDGKTDTLDYSIWFDTFVRKSTAYGIKADLGCNGTVTIDDYQVWLENSSLI